MITFKVDIEREDDGRWLAEVVELPGVLAYGETQEAGALSKGSSPCPSGHRGAVRKHRMALAGDERLYAEAGFFMSYGANVPEFFPHAATYIDKILRGAKPADLPVEQPSKFELLFNLETAKALEPHDPAVGARVGRTRSIE